jgi:hypothetical protein
MNPEPSSRPASAPRLEKRGPAGRKRKSGLDRKIERMASGRSEFHGNVRRPSGFLTALLELVELMGPEVSGSSPGTRSPAAPRRA